MPAITMNGIPDDSDHDQPPEKAARAIPRSVILVSWVSFFADVSSEMAYPLLPMFVVGVLGASATALGWVEGLATLTIALMSAWAGWRSDRRGSTTRVRRVPYIRWGYGLPVVGKALITAATGWPMVMTGRMVDRIGKGLRGGPRDALIADATPAAIRGRAFGLHRMMDTAGATAGVLIAALLLWRLLPQGAGGDSTMAREGTAEAFRWVFGIAASLGLVSLALTFFVKEHRDASPGGAARFTDETAPETETKSLLALPGEFWRTLLVFCVFGLANSTDAFLLLRARDTGLSPWGVAFAYAVCNTMYTVSSYPAGIVSDRLGRWRVIMIGWATYSLVYAGFAVTGSFGLWALLGLYGIYLGLTDGVAKALVADHAPRHRRGRAMGIFAMANGVATLMGSVVAGVLWDRVGTSAPFWFGAGGALAAVVLAAVLRPRSAAAHAAR